MHNKDKRYPKQLFHKRVSKHQQFAQTIKLTLLAGIIHSLLIKVEEHMLEGRTPLKRRMCDYIPILCLIE